MRWRLTKNSGFAAFASLLVAAGSVSPVLAITTVQSQVCDDFAAPAIVSPNDGTQTKENTIMIEGTGEPYKTVAVIRDGTSQGAATIAADGSFGFTVPLVQGDNTLIARETNECGTAKDSPAVTVTADLPVPPIDEPSTPTTETPSVDQPVVRPSTGVIDRPFVPAPNTPGFETPKITTPGDGAIVYLDTFLLEGTAHPGSLVTVYVNGRSQAQVTASAGGIFGVRIVLRAGHNTIKVRSVYNDASAVSSTVDVTYIKKVTATLARPLSRTEILTTVATAGAAVTGGATVAIAVNWSLHKFHFKFKFWRQK